MSTQEKDLEGILERAQIDADFRARLMADPKGVLEQELDIELPEDAEIRVVEEGPNQLHLILPSTPMTELSDDELDEAAGGLAFSFRRLRTIRSRFVRGPFLRFS